MSNKCSCNTPVMLMFLLLGFIFQGIVNDIRPLSIEQRIAVTLTWPIWATAGAAVSWGKEIKESK